MKIKKTYFFNRVENQICLISWAIAFSIFLYIFSTFLTNFISEFWFKNAVNLSLLICIEGYFLDIYIATVESLYHKIRKGYPFRRWQPWHNKVEKYLKINPTRQIFWNSWLLIWMATTKKTSTCLVKERRILLSALWTWNTQRKLWATKYYCLELMNIS